MRVFNEENEKEFKSDKLGVYFENLFRNIRFHVLYKAIKYKIDIYLKKIFLKRTIQGKNCSFRFSKRYHRIFIKRCMHLYIQSETFNFPDISCSFIVLLK